MGSSQEKRIREMIQKLEQYVIGANYGCGGASFSEVIDKVNEVIDYINSRPEEKPSKDLEEAAKEYASKTLCDPDDGPSVGLVKDAFIAGAEWQKEQMIKDAKEIITIQRSLTEPEFVKQRVIFLKED